MARPNGDPADLLRRLNAALAVAKPRDVVDARVMSDIVGMTWRNLLLTHIEPDKAFPVQKRGAEGVAWEFRVVKVLRHMVKRAQGRIAKGDAAARRVHQLTGFNVPDAGEGAMSLSDLSKMAELTIKAQAAKERQGMYIPALRVRDFLGLYNAAVRDGILGVPSKVDPTGSLTPEIRALIDNEVRSALAAAEARVQSFLKEYNAGSQQAGGF